MPWDAQTARRLLMEKTPPQEPVRAKDLLSTGSTLLNLALTGRARGGFVAGTYVLLVGDSSSGKTFLACTCLAEACYNKRFRDHRLIYDDVEHGALMDLHKFFGPRLAERLEPPARDKQGKPLRSQTIEEFYAHLYDNLEAGPCIYVLDSMDALSSEQEATKFKARRNAMKRGPAAVAKLTGEMTDGKAKKNSSHIRQIHPLIERTGSILVVISQTRDNIETFSFETKTRAGGRALRFYAAGEVWTERAGVHRAKYGKLDLQTGIRVRVRTKKNRISGKEWDIEVPIYHTYGIDDIGSCVDFLVKAEHWPKAESGGSITAAEFDLKGTREKLVQKIEAADRVQELRNLVQDVWEEIEAAVALKRKPRYG